jgi:hypothetical protein
MTLYGVVNHVNLNMGHYTDYYYYFITHILTSRQVSILFVYLSYGRIYILGPGTMDM